jgi:hypothetical protein
MCAGPGSVPPVSLQDKSLEELVEEADRGFGIGPQSEVMRRVIIALNASSDAIRASSDTIASLTRWLIRFTVVLVVLTLALVVIGVWRS